MKKNRTVFNLFIAFLSLVSLAAILLEKLKWVTGDAVVILNTLDHVLCVFFLADFVMRFTRAESKLAYMKWGWIDLLSSIPMIEALRWGRLFRILRVIRAIRGIHSAQLFKLIFSNKAKGALFSLACVSVLLVTAGAITILEFETSANSNINTAEDAIWWAFVTMTTVGYGDFYPVTTTGRVLATILMVLGIGLFGTFTGYVATLFEIREPNEGEDSEDTASEIKVLRDEIRELKELIRALPTHSDSR